MSERSDKAKLSINQWAEEDRPREKMLSKGIDALSDAELLAILIGSGNTEETAVELMRRMLDSCGNHLHELSKWDFAEFSRFKGIGQAKATTIMAALELGKRRKDTEVHVRPRVRTSIDVYRIFHPLLCDLPNEEVWILLLNTANTVIDKVRISTGGIDGAHADVRTMLRHALLKRATGMALCHNHPSGNSQPSTPDRQLTESVRRAAETMNIRLIDHVIVCDGHYYSFADEGLL